MTVIELLDGLISDMKDYANEYRYRIKHPSNRIESYEYSIRLKELIEWINMLKTIHSEQEQND